MDKRKQGWVKENTGKIKNKVSGTEFKLYELEEPSFTCKHHTYKAIPYYQGILE